MVAMYRIAVEGWSKEAAIREMISGGFGHHAIFRNLRAYLKRVDVASVRRAAGLLPAAAAALEGTPGQKGSISALRNL
jgi:hypothetical protein